MLELKMGRMGLMGEMGYLSEQKKKALFLNGKKKGCPIVMNPESWTKKLSGFITVSATLLIPLF